MKNKCIVFCDEHYNPLGLVRTLGENKIEPYLIILEKDYHLVEKSKYAKRKKVFRVKTVEEGYNLLFSKFNNEQLKPIIFTSDDTITGFLNDHYNELKDHFYFYNAGEEGRLNFYQNKKNIIDAAKKAGIDVLPSIVVNKGCMDHGIEYPVITKALDSFQYGWKSDSHICENAKQLKAAYKSIKSKKVVIQKFINKKNEYCLDGFSYNKGKKVFNSIESTYQYCIKGTYSPYMTVKNFNNPGLKRKLNKLFADIGFEGIYSVEFLIDDQDNYYFLEINFRNSTWSYASTCVGMPLPILWAKAVTGNLGKNYERNVKDNFTAMVEFNDFKYRVAGKKVSLFQWLKDFKNCDCKYLIGKHDIKPFLYTFIYKVKTKLKKRSN